MKSRGKKIRSYKVPPSWIEENVNSLNYFAFFSKPKENASKLVEIAEKNNIEIPKGICANLSDDDFNKMMDVSMGMKPLWENALGKDWEKQMTRDRLRALYEKL